MAWGAGRASARSRILSFLLILNVGLAPSAPAWAAEPASAAPKTDLPTVEALIQQHGGFKAAPLPAMDMSGVMASIPECAQASVMGMGAGSLRMPMIDAENLSCPMLKDASGGYKQKIEEFRQASQAMAQQADIAEKQITCAQKTLQAMNGIFKNFETELQNNLNDKEAQVRKGEEWMADSKAKIDFIDSEVRPDLERAKADAEGFLGGDAQNPGIAGIIQRNESAIRMQRSAEKALVQQKKMAVMSATMKCFKERKVEGLYCLGQDGSKVPASAYEHSVCVYQREAQKGSNGQLRAVGKGDGTAKTDVKSATHSIKSMLDQMVGSVPDPKVLDPATDPKGGAPSIDLSSFQNTTPAELERTYSGQLSSLSQFGTGNQQRTIPLREFVLTQIQSCYNDKKAAVEKMSGVEFGPIRARENALKENEEQIKTGMRQVFTKSQFLWERMMTATGRRADASEKMDLSQCDDARPEGQVSCLKTIRQQVTGMLHGGTAYSKRPMNIKGTMDNAQIAFTCDGLNACTNALRNLRANLHSANRAVETKLKNFKAEVNANFQKELANRAQSVAGINKAVQERIAGLSGILSAMGVRKGLRFEKLESGPACVPGPSGICQMPRPIEAAMGAMVNPPVAPIDEESLAEMRSALDRKVREASKNLAAVEAQAAECVAKAKKDAEQEFKEFKGAAAKCMKNRAEYCDAGGVEQDLANWINRINAQENKDKNKEDLAFLDAHGFGSLRSGKSSAACVRYRSGLETLNAEEESSRKRLNDELEELKRKIADFEDRQEGKKSIPGKISRKRSELASAGCNSMGKKPEPGQVQNCKNISDELGNLEKDREKLVAEKTTKQREIDELPKAKREAVAKLSTTGEYADEEPDCSRIAANLERSYGNIKSARELGTSVYGGQ